MSKDRGTNPKAISPDLTYGPGAKDFAYDGPVEKIAPEKKDDKDKKDEPGEERRAGQGTKPKREVAKAAAVAAAALTVSSPSANRPRNAASSGPAATMAASC